jgi:ribosomal protein S18 acetylase RimI-like enzyme
MRQAARIQAYLRETARCFYEAEPVRPFTCFFHATDALRYFNYAIPDEPAAGDLGEPLERLREEFRHRERLPRFEYVEGFAPDLAAALERAGFELELRAPLMTARAKEIAPPPAIEGFDIVPASTDIRVYLTVGRRAFGAGDEPQASDEEVEARQARKDVSTALIGLLDGEPVAVGAATPPLDGLSEVAGIGVLEPARRRGIGAAMTAAAARDAATKGADVVFLAPGTDAAQSVYTRVGFRPAEISLYYADPG